MFKRQAPSAKSRIPSVDPDFDINAPAQSHFPIIIFLAAVTKDIIADPIILMLTLLIMPLGWLFGAFLNILFSLILWLWFIQKANFIRRLMWRRFFVRVLIAAVIGFIPGLRFIVPEHTILVFFTYRHEKRVIREWNKRLEKTKSLF